MAISERLIRELISQGENEKVEFKTSLLNENNIAKVLTAFANTEGGFLFVGVGDRGQIIGLLDEEAILTEKRLSKICSSLFTFAYEVDSIKLDGRNIVFAYISKAPLHLEGIATGSGEFYVRKEERNIKVEMKQNTLYKVENPLKTSESKIIGFVAMSLRTEEEPVLIDYYNAMLRAATRTKLSIELIRIDLNEGDFEISQHIMEEIKRSDFVLADFTLDPHNVYFEVGYARGVEKRIIQTARNGTTLQFDVRNWITLFYRNATELEEKLISKFEAVYNEITT